MDDRVILLDGSVGTALWKMTNLTDEVWNFNITKPEVVLKLHKDYIEAGSKIITTNTFSANKMSLSKSEYNVEQVVREAVKIAKKAVSGTDTKVALDIGPLTELLEPYGDLTEEECEEIYTEIIDSGMKESPDLIFLETFMDIEMLKIAAKVANKYDVPLFCSMTFEPIGKTIMGNSVQDMINELKDLKVVAIGMNCSLEPEASLPVIKTFRELTDMPLIFKPNAGKPQYNDGEFTSKTDEEVFAQSILPAVKIGNIHIGGCCGTDPNYIKRMAELFSEN